MDTGKDLEFVCSGDFFLCLPSDDQLMHIIEEFPSFLDGFAFQRFGHERSGGFGDGAAAAFESNFLDDTVLDDEENAVVVSAEGILPAGRMGRVLQRTKVSWPPAMIEDHLLIEVVQFFQHGSFICNVGSVGV